MGKPKKGSRKDDDFDSDNDDMGPQTQDDTHPENTEQVVKKADKKKNKKKGKQKDDDDWGESESNAKTLDAFKDSDLEDDIPVAATKKNKNKKKGMSAFAMLANIDGDDGGDDDFSDKDMEEEPPKSKAKAKGTSAFAMLSSMDDDVQMDDDDIDDKKSDVEENSVKEVVQQPKKKEKTKKSKKKEDEEDIDAILADIEKPASKADKKKKKKNKGDAAEDEENNEEEAETPAVEVEKMESKVVTIDDLDDEYFEDEKKKKKKNKKKGKEEEAAQETKETEDAEGGDEDEFKMKSAAQKKKEKKEREKQKKLEEKQKQLKKDQAKKEKEGTKEAEKSSKEPEATASHEATPEADEGEGGDGQEKAGKKKRKKKVEKEKEEEKVKPKNKQIAALREALRIQKEEEELAKRELERFRLEEEERIRLLEEEEQRKEEAKKKKKDAKKEREAQLKKEGKWLTAKQRQDKQKLEQMLEAMKMTGVEVGPRAAAEKPSKQGFVYTKKKRPTDNKEKSPSEPTSPTEGSPEVEMKDGSEEAKKEVEVTIEVKEEEVKDAWDADSDEGEEEEDEKEDAVPEKSKAKPAAKEEEEDDDDDDDDDDESEEESSEEESSEEETDESESESDDDEKTPIDRGREKVQKRAEKAEKVRTLDHLRAPVVCVLGHVDTGKTKILDKLRRTNVQDGEAGGITQQIGATNVPKDAITEKTKMVKEFAKQDLKIPGLLIIDTPGHESFSNLRIRGSSLCDIAILVIDIMHGLEPQTRESINLLKDRKTPFLVALNKVDRLYQWKAQPMNDVQNTVKKQSAHTKAEFDERTQAVIVQLAEEGLNAALFYENKNQREYVSMVPTSAHTGDGMGNLVALVCDLCQNMLAKRLMYSPDLQATVMEVKAITGMGTTIDVILINGSLNEGDSIVLAGTEGPIVTQIRGLLMPQPMKELRVKNQYEHHKTVMAAQGVKINAKEMEKALAGLPLFVAHDTDERDYYKDEVSIVLKDTLESIKVQDKGVFVQASTLGSLEALLEFLRTSKIPYAGINIGPVHKKDIMKASVMLEHDSQYAVILAFDVKVEREAQDLAENVGVRIFTADIIYHLFDSFMKYREDCKRQKQEEFKHIAVFPCRLKILPQYIFNSRDPIVMGVIVESGFVKEGTPICVPTKEFVDIGRVGSLELNHKQIDVARQGQEICIKILPIPGEAPKMYGRHFEDSDMLVSKISRTSIDAVKDYFRDEMTKQDWKLMVELKKEFAIL